MGVPELDKPLQTKCVHVCSSGCSIYRERPASCRVFRCLWLQGVGGRELRPDRSRVMLTVNDTGNVLVAMELDKGAATRPGPMEKFLAGYVAQGRLAYLVHPDDSRTIWTRDRGKQYVPPTAVTRTTDPDGHTRDVTADPANPAQSGAPEALQRPETPEPSPDP
jgi:hypothetical protein